MKLSSRLFVEHLALYSYTTHYAPFITRSESCGFVREQDVPIASPDTLLSLIRLVIPFIDIDEDMYERRDE